MIFIVERLTFFVCGEVAQFSVERLRDFSNSLTQVA